MRRLRGDADEARGEDINGWDDELADLDELKEAEIRRGDWHDPDAGKILFGDYADTCINDHVLKPRTEELYRGLLRTT